VLSSLHIRFHIMKPVQIVLDAELLVRIDRAARKRRLSRSGYVRESLEAVLRAQRIRELVEAERLAYARKPPTADERAAARSLSKGQDRLLARLAREDSW
jgi:metal-responsive CopG/Arc/MetJ family transcriptional regulator